MRYKDILVSLAGLSLAGSVKADSNSTDSRITCVTNEGHYPFELLPSSFYSGNFQFWNSVNQTWTWYPQNTIFLGETECVERFDDYSALGLDYVVKTIDGVSTSAGFYINQYVLSSNQGYDVVMIDYDLYGGNATLIETGEGNYTANYTIADVIPNAIYGGCNNDDKKFYDNMTDPELGAAVGGTAFGLIAIGALGGYCFAKKQQTQAVNDAPEQNDALEQEASNDKTLPQVVHVPRQNQNSSRGATEDAMKSAIGNNKNTATSYEGDSDNQVRVNQWNEQKSDLARQKTQAAHGRMHLWALAQQTSSIFTTPQKHNDQTESLISNDKLNRSDAETGHNIKFG